MTPTRALNILGPRVWWCKNRVDAGVGSPQPWTDAECETYDITPEQRVEMDAEERVRDFEAEYAETCDEWAAWRLVFAGIGIDLEAEDLDRFAPFEVAKRKVRARLDTPVERLLRAIFGEPNPPILGDDDDL